jgi:uncharacterized protein (TIGR02466 family)
MWHIEKHLEDIGHVSGNPHSPVDNWFPVPIYSDGAREDNLQKIQSEIEFSLNDLKEKDKLVKNPHWNPNTHRLSDIGFNDDIIDFYNMDNLLDEIAWHVQRYMTVINAPVNKTKRFKILQSWITQTLNNEFAHPHTHGSVDLAGVYYFKTNGEDGSLYFNSPVGQMDNSWVFEHVPTRSYYRPRVGNMVLFPGWLEHGTDANTTDNERISISFNIVFEREYLIDK